LAVSKGRGGGGGESWKTKVFANSTGKKKKNSAALSWTNVGKRGVTEKGKNAEQPVCLRAEAMRNSCKKKLVKRRKRRKSGQLLQGVPSTEIGGKEQCTVVRGGEGTEKV